MSKLHILKMNNYKQLYSNINTIYINVINWGMVDE